MAAFNQEKFSAFVVSTMSKGLDELKMSPEEVMSSAIVVINRCAKLAGIAPSKALRILAQVLDDEG
jgi:hypothetical protein